MKWFGPRWDAPVCDEGTEVEAPLGDRCRHCSEAIEEGDRGLVLVYYSPEAVLPFDYPIHLECLEHAIGNPR